MIFRRCACFECCKNCQFQNVGGACFTKFFDELVFENQYKGQKFTNKIVTQVKILN